MVDLDVHTTDGRRCTVQLLQRTTLAAATKAARQQLLLVTGQGVGGDAPDAYARAGTDCLRLRRFSPASGRGGAPRLAPGWSPQRRRTMVLAASPCRGSEDSPRIRMLPGRSRFLWANTRPLTVLSVNTYGQVAQVTPTLQSAL